MRTREHVFLGRHENKRTCFFGGDMRTEEHVFLEDMRTREHVFWEDKRTREHEKKGKGLIEQNENKRFGWAWPNTRFLRYSHLNHWIFHSSLFTLHFSLNIWIFHSSLNISFACSSHRTQTTQKLFLFYYALRGNRNDNVSLRLQKSHIFNNVFHDA